MAREALPFVVIMAGVALGTATLLFGETAGSDLLLYGGGIVALLSVAGLTGAIARTGERSEGRSG